MRRIFLDTNIILDFLTVREAFYVPVAEVLTLADQGKIRLFTTPTSLTNVYYVLSKHTNPTSALEKIRKFKLICNMAKTDDEVIEKALNSQFKDFEDAIQYFSAIASNCEVIITRNEKDFKNVLIPVMNATSYLLTRTK